VVRKSWIVQYGAGFSKFVNIDLWRHLCRRLREKGKKPILLEHVSDYCNLYGHKIDADKAESVKFKGISICNKMYKAFVKEQTTQDEVFKILHIVRCPNLTLPYFDALFDLLSMIGYELTAKDTLGLSDC